jgi:hypothetical protein
LASTQHNTQMIGLFIGIARDGKQQRANGMNGVYFTQTATAARIGMRGPSAFTVISGNMLSGVNASGPQLHISSSFIGTDSSGNSPMGNVRAGVMLYAGAARTVIGDYALENVTTIPGPVVISANKISGITSHAPNTQISNVYVGVGRNGYTALGNRNTGIYLGPLAINSCVGDYSKGTEGGSSYRNLIGNNEYDGIQSAAANTVINNAFIGFALQPTGPNTSQVVRAPNGLSGVFLLSGSDTSRVGMTTPSNRVVISGNLKHGVHVQSRQVSVGSVAKISAHAFRFRVTEFLEQHGFI